MIRLHDQFKIMVFFNFKLSAFQGHLQKDIKYMDMLIEK
jgi:hypothetical protein